MSKLNSMLDEVAKVREALENFADPLADRIRKDLVNHDPFSEAQTGALIIDSQLYALVLSAVMTLELAEELR